MPLQSTVSTRSPRGTRPVLAAFFAALDLAPEAQRAAIAKAAQNLIRDELKLRRDRGRAAVTRSKARKPTTPAAKTKRKAVAS